VKRLLSVIVMATATVPMIAVPAADAGGGGCHSTRVRDARGVQVQLTEACFDPAVIRIKPGQRVRWTNQDPMTHNVIGVGGSWGSGQDLNEGDSVTEEFGKSGVFPYFCIFHPGMVGAVVVGDGTSSATVIDNAGVVTVPEQPPAAPPAAQPAAQLVPTPVAAERDNGPVIAALLALAGAVLIGAVVLLARRTPGAEPHPQV
jgi:plastocyanin